MLLPVFSRRSPYLIHPLFRLQLQTVFGFRCPFVAGVLACAAVRLRQQKSPAAGLPGAVVMA
jgi:hypothetical protein